MDDTPWEVAERHGLKKEAAWLRRYEERRVRVVRMAYVLTRGVHGKLLAS